MVRPSGENHPNAKLTLKQVEEIRRRVAEGERQLALAREYGVSQRTISLIIRNWSYRQRDDNATR